MVDLDGGYAFDETHQIIGEALKARGVQFLDTLPAFRGQEAETLWVHPSDRHPNDAAHDIFARALLPTLRAAVSARN